MSTPPRLRNIPNPKQHAYINIHLPDRGNATSLLKLAQRAVIKAADHDAELERIFPGFDDNRESLSFRLAEGIDLFRTALLEKISAVQVTLDKTDARSSFDSKTLVARQDQRPRVSILEQAISEIIITAPLVSGQTLPAELLPPKTDEEEECEYMVVGAAVRRMLASNRPGRALALLADSGALDRVGKFPAFDFELYYWESFTMLSANVRKMQPDLLRHLPNLPTRGSGFFGNTSWIFRLQDLAKSQWHHQDCLGLLVHSLLEHIGKDGGREISPSKRREFIDEVVVFSRDARSDLRDVWGQSPIHYAARYDLPDLVLALLNGGVASPDESSQGGQTPLHYAAATGNVEICRVLVHHGADLNGWDAGELGSHTALGYAARKGHVEVIQLLLAQDGIDPNSGYLDHASSRSGSTPLMMALSSGSPSSTIYQVILNHPRTEITRINGEGQTVLHIAIQGGNITAVKDILLVVPEIWLIVNIQDDQKSTPLSLAAQIQDHHLCAEMVRALMDAATNPFAHRETEVDLTDKNGLAPLHHAAHNGNLEACRAIVASGKQWRVKSVLGSRCELRKLTPSEYAQQSGHLETASWLQRQGEELSLLDH